MLTNPLTKKEAVGKSANRFGYLISKNSTEI